MFCRHCGKEISDEAFMCPDCGTPTIERKNKNIEIPNQLQNSDKKEKGISIIGFLFALIAFITGIIFGSFFFVFSASVVLLYVISATTILPALTSLAIGIYTIITSTENSDKICKPRHNFRFVKWFRRSVSLHRQLHNRCNNIKKRRCF